MCTIRLSSQRHDAQDGQCAIEGERTVGERIGAIAIGMSNFRAIGEQAHLVILYFEPDR